MTFFLKVLSGHRGPDSTLITKASPNFHSILYSAKVNVPIRRVSFLQYNTVVVLDSLIQRDVLVTEETTVTQRVSRRPIERRSDPARGHKDFHELCMYGHI